MKCLPNKRTYTYKGYTYCFVSMENTSPIPFLSSYENAVKWSKETNETGLDRIQVNGEPKKINQVEQLLQKCKQTKMETIRLVSTCKYANDNTVRSILEKINHVDSIVDMWWTEPGKNVTPWCEFDEQNLDTGQANYNNKYITNTGCLLFC